MKKLGAFIKDGIKEVKSFRLTDLKEGVNDTGNHFIKLSKDKQIDYVIDKVCNHAGGKLILKDSKAVCPMHGWQLNMETLSYNNSHVCKEQLAYDIDDHGNLLIDDFKNHLINPFKGPKKGTVTLRWLNHAAVYIECNGVSLITDPWLFGPAFMTGWWLSAPSPAESIDLLKKADYVFISHNHPDHLHAETLAVLPRDKKMIVADFTTKSAEKYLRSLAFENIIRFPFNEIVELTPGFQISILKSGDFRDDSGIYICANGHEFLLTVDSNFLNAYVLPQHIDLLMTSFAGGATGFPLCFENYNEEEKLNVIKRNRASIKFSVNQYLQATQPTYYMPYAGMFKEYSFRDQYIREHNIKNSPSDYIPYADKVNCTLLHPTSSEELVFHDGTLTTRKLNTSYLAKEDSYFYVNKLKEEYPYDENKIIGYLKESNYTGKQIIQIIPTDDNFQVLNDNVIFADFNVHRYEIISLHEVIEEKENYRVMQLKIRPEILMCIIENNLPWEDFAIGFQMRVKRIPNEYESDFWYHFTNNYIGGHNFRYSSFCGACTVIDQNPIWLQ